MTYKCYFCESTFDSKELIDGFSEGYRVGFLCPKCNENIQGAHFTVYKNPGTSVYAKWLFYAAMFGAYALTWVDDPYWCYLLVYFCMLGLGMLYGYIKYGSDFFSNTMATQPAPGK